MKASDVQDEKWGWALDPEDFRYMEKMEEARLEYEAWCLDRMYEALDKQGVTQAEKAALLNQEE